MMGHDRTDSELYQRLIDEARTPRAEPRIIAGLSVFEDPAPDWYWMLVDAILRRTYAILPDHGEALCRRAIAWCREPLPAPRAHAEEWKSLLLRAYVLEAPAACRVHPKWPRASDLHSFLHAMTYLSPAEQCATIAEHLIPDVHNRAKRGFAMVPLRVEEGKFATMTFRLGIRPTVIRGGVLEGGSYTLRPVSRSRETFYERKAQRIAERAKR